MTDTTEKPLITFALIAYQQERFIREAAEGALAQTYSPLQIIFSDDASHDLTFEIMSQLASAYTGPHRLLLNRNSANLGIGAHVNRIMELSEGELVVIAAGDDVSVLGRVELIHERWVCEGKPKGSIFSDTIEVEEDGTHTGRRTVPRRQKFDLVTMLKGSPPPILGSTHAWHRFVFEVFGPLKDGVVNEDNAIFFRSSLLGSVLHIHEPLVLHRGHPGSIGDAGHSSAITPDAQLQVCRTVYQRQIVLGENYLRDLQTFAAEGRQRADLHTLFAKVAQYISFSRAAHEFAGMCLSRRARVLLPLLARCPSARSMRPILTQCFLPRLTLALHAMKGSLRLLTNRLKWKRAR